MVVPDAADVVQARASRTGETARWRCHGAVEPTVLPPAAYRGLDRDGPCGHDRAVLRFADRLRAAWVRCCVSNSVPQFAAALNCADDER
jgi:hypothetical protein